MRNRALGNLELFSKSTQDIAELFLQQLSLEPSQLDLELSIALKDLYLTVK